MTRVLFTFLFPTFLFPPLHHILSFIFHPTHSLPLRFAFLLRLATVNGICHCVRCEPKHFLKYLRYLSFNEVGICSANLCVNIFILPLLMCYVFELWIYGMCVSRCRTNGRFDLGRLFAKREAKEKTFAKSNESIANVIFPGVSFHQATTQQLFGVYLFILSLPCSSTWYCHRWMTLDRHAVILFV